MPFWLCFSEPDIQLLEPVPESDFDINHLWLSLNANEGKIFFWFSEESTPILLSEAMIQEDNFVSMCLNEIPSLGASLEGEQGFSQSELVLLVFDRYFFNGLKLAAFGDVWMLPALSNQAPVSTGPE